MASQSTLEQTTNIPDTQFKASDLADLGGFGGAATTTEDDDDIDEKPPTYMLFSLCCYVVNPVFGMLAIICSILSGNYFDEGEVYQAKRYGKTAFGISIAGLVVDVVLIMIVTALVETGVFCYSPKLKGWTMGCEDV